MLNSIKEKWNGLPKWAKWSIGGGALLALFLVIRSSSQPVRIASQAIPEQPSGTGKIGDADVAAQVGKQLAALESRINDRVTDLESDVGSAVTGVAQMVAQTKQEQSTVTSGIVSGLTGLIREQNEDTRAQLDVVTKLAQDTAGKVAAGYSADSSKNNKTGSIPKVENDDAPAKSNQVRYLEDLKQTGNSGQKEWANQALYLENLKTDGNAGQKKWAEEQLSKLYGK